jgi:transposase
MNNRNVIAIDLAKNILQGCVITKHGELLSNKAYSPNKLNELLINSVPSVVVMEGCGSCHHWGRFAQEHGHTVRIINPRKVKAYRQGHKTDANDALAIAAAYKHIGIKFCPVKTEEQQIMQTLETSRQLLSKHLTAMGNHLRAYVYEYGIVMRKGRKTLGESMTHILDEEENRLPECLKAGLRTLWEQYQHIEEKLKSIEKEKAAIVRQFEPCKRLLDLEGVGEVGASLLYINIGDGSEFKNGRQAAACVGVTPKQHSSGGKTIMTGIQKHGGIKELRRVLYQGALAVISQLPEQPRTAKQKWLIDLVKRAGIKRACIALANKTVRTAWALLSSGKTYQPIMLKEA